MGPRPLPVTMVGGGPAAPPPGRPPAPTEPIAARLLRQGGQLAGAAASAAGNAGAGAAANAVLPAVTGALSVASRGLAMLGPYGIAAAAAVQAFGAAVGAGKQVIDAFVARGRELVPYSGTLAGAAARADVRRIQGDIKEAEKLGPSFAKLIEAQSKTEAVIQRTLVPIKEFIATKLAEFLEALLKLAVGGLEALDDLTFHKIKELNEIVKDIKAIMKGDSDVTLIDKWIAPVAGPAPPVAGMGVPIGGGLGVPLIGGF